MKAHPIMTQGNEFVKSHHPSVHSAIDMSIPKKIVTIGPRDPEYITPLVKLLLEKRRKCLRKSLIHKDNDIAAKINYLIIFTAELDVL